MKLKIFLQKIRFKVTGERNTFRNQQGMVLVLVLMMLLLFTAIGILLMYMVASTIKSSGLLKSEEIQFYGAEGGVLAVTAYMTVYHQGSAPEDITTKASYYATTTPLGQTIAYPIGYSTQWKGFNMKINSVSPPPPATSTAEIEAVVFIPVAPAGYGNE